MRVLLGILLATTLAYAETFTAEKPTTVYSRPDPDSEALGKLKAGREVEIERKSAKWLRISIKSSKGKVKGFVRVEEAGDLDEDEAPGETGSGFRIALALFYSYYIQSSRVFTDSDGNQSDISNLTGSEPYFGFLLEYPSSKKLIYRAGLSLRTVNLKGTVKYRSGSVTTTDTPIEIQQSFFSFLGGARYLFSGNIWAGVFGEYSMGTQSTVFGTASEKPNYFIIQPAIGYDHKITKSFFVMPEFRLGIFVNTKPLMFNPEVSVSSGYEF